MRRADQTTSSRLGPLDQLYVFEKADPRPELLLLPPVPSGILPRAPEQPDPEAIAQKLEHDLPFDPSYGYSLTDLVEVRRGPGPKDFADFWRSTYEEAMDVPLRLEVSKQDRGTSRVRIHEVELDAFGGARLGGWLTLPRDGEIKEGLVVGHGYGGRARPDPSLPGPNTAALFICARGFDRSANPAFPNNAAEHVIHGIETKEAYLHRGCAADIWAAASALIEAVPESARHLSYSGVSFGGGIGALALPWDPRFKSGMLGLASFGNHPLRLQLPCTGSGDSVQKLSAEDARVAQTLEYFDAALAAQHLEIPMLFANALFDPAVPPPGQWSISNMKPGEKEVFLRAAGHFAYGARVQDDIAMREAWRNFMARVNPDAASAR